LETGNDDDNIYNGGGDGNKLIVKTREIYSAARFSFFPFETWSHHVAIMA
jgi:hypothetical protein